MAKSDFIHCFALSPASVYPIRIRCWWVLVHQAGCPKHNLAKSTLVAPSSTQLELGVGGRRPARLGVGPLRSGKSQVHSRHHDLRFARQYESNAIRFHAPRFRFLLERSFSECALFLPGLVELISHPSVGVNAPKLAHTARSATSTCAPKTECGFR